jgi:hypothetical protein
MGHMGESMKAWFDLGNGRKIFRAVPERTDAAKSSLPSPYFVTDTIPETRSMADNKLYTSKKAMRASYRADGNPQGVNYVELGNDEMKPFTRPERDRAGDRAAIERAISAVESGTAPPVLRELPKL